MGIDEFGNFIYRRLRGLKLDASQLPRLHRNTVNLFDKAGERNSFSSVIHKRTVIHGTAINRGTFRSKKVGGFGSVFERRRIGKIRRENELKRKLHEAGIDESKLSLLLHSALHSQTLFEKEVPVKRLPGYKKGGISAKERREMERQRRRNNRLYAHGTIYRRY